MWFVFLLGFTAALEVRHYQEQRPCREWKTSHPGRDSQDILQERQSDGSYAEVGFNPCTVVMWESMPIWVKVCSLGWLISCIGFICSLIQDIFRWIMARRSSSMVVQK